MLPAKSRGYWVTVTVTERVFVPCAFVAVMV
jgi:hypothetical protein